MSATPIVPPEPVRDLDWDATRAREVGAAAIDLWADLLTGLRDLPVSRMEPADEVAAAVRLPIPAEGMAPEELIEVLRPLVLEQAVYPGHPGFLAYISGGGTVPGAAADLIAAGLNANPGGWSLSGGVTEFELALMRWLASRFGLPEGAGGLVTSGGATSNITALKAARDAALPDVRTAGLGGRPVAFYASTESHATILEAADMIGAGESSVRLIGTDDALRMRVDLLESAIAADRAAGITPIAVVGTAGTTGPGTIDPLPSIAEVCRREGIWFHVDAAYGGAAVFSTPLRPLLAGIERADTITFDPHKWLSVPLAAAVLLAREPDLLLSAFDHEAAYTREARERTRIGENLGSYSQAWSRSFSALKIWASLAGHGTDAYDRRLAHDVELARYLAARIEAEPTLELGIAPVLPIVCFRTVAEGRTDEELDDLNERLMEAIRREGRVFPSNAEIGGRYFIRACISNFRTEAEQMDELVEAAVRIVAELS
jgi:glutamate/tyrosine decarboxylase-like PLP-dependent enzyme